MKNMKKIFVLIIVLLFCSFVRVEAVTYHNPEEYLCGTQNMNALLGEIRNVKINYEFNNDKTKGRHFKIKISNLNENIVIKVLGMTYSYEQNGDSFYLINTISIKGGTIPIEFYGGLSHPCVDQYITVKKITIPKYNIYSELDDCIEYEEFPLCDRFYDGEINGSEDFYKQLGEFKNSLNKEIPDEQRSIFEIIKEFIEDNQLLCASILIIVIIIAIILTIRSIYRWAHRQKIKFDVDINK